LFKCLIRHLFPFVSQNQEFPESGSKIFPYLAALHVCAMGNGIRRSKDLRARFRKFLILTNERKQMSNKTLKQRIAVVAASALTAGFLSVVAMPAANAAAELTVTTTTGLVAAPSTTASVGTGTISSTGTVKLAVAAAAASTLIQVRISGGTFTGITSGASINADGSVATGTAQATAIVGLDAKPTGAGRNMVVKTYLAVTPTAAVDTTGLDASTTFHSSYTFTVVAPGSAGVASAGDSKVLFVNNGSAGTTINAGSLTTDLAYADVVGAGGLGMLAYNMYDANSTILNAATTTSTATVKSGACVVGTSTTTSIITSAYATASAGAFYVAQTDSTNTPAATCTIEVAAGGVVVATKTFKFQGPLAAIQVSGQVRGAITTSSQSTMGYLTATDSAGNYLGGVVITGALDNATDVAFITAVGGGTTAKKASTVNGGVLGDSAAPTSFAFTSSGVATNGVPVKFKSTNGIGGFIYSPVYQLKTSGTPVTYTASLDKASYVPGDIATLTVSGKDSKGFVANDVFAIESATAADQITLAGSQLTLVGTLGTTGAFGSGTGTKTYKFVVGTTEGSYNLVVEAPLISTANNKVLYGAAAQTVAYKVAAGTATVSNADVLKSIVALIASINKQIQALQKLILARR